MRVPMITTNRRYNNHLAGSADRINRSLERVNTGRRYMRASQDPVAASKVSLLRQNIANTENYIENAEYSKSTLEAQYSTGLIVKERLDTAYEQVLKAKNGTLTQQERDILKSTIQNTTNEIFSTVNSQAAGKYNFGGSDNAAPPLAWNVDPITGDRTLTYHGQDVSAGGPFPMDADVFVDIGLGLTIDATGQVDPMTGLQVSASAVDLLGSGTTTVTLADGTDYDVPQNSIEILEEIATHLDPYNEERVDILLGALTTNMSKVTGAITDISDRAKFAEFNNTRLDADLTNAQTVRQEVEFLTPIESINLFKMDEFIYNTTLQMGPKVIQPSLFDFLR